MSSILKEAVRLADLGFSVLWLHKRSKRPIEAEWTELEVATPKRLKATYREGNNLGVRLGRPSRIGKYFLHVIDMDIRDPEFTDEARAKVANLLKVDLEDFSTVISGSGGDSRHFYLLSTEPFRSRKLWHSKEKFTDEDGKKHWCAEIEFFGTGKQVALPPSIHPSGEPYRWEVPLDVDTLPVIDAELLDGLVGHDDPLDYEEVDEVEPLGLSRGEALDMITELQDWADDRETWARVGMALRHEFGEDGWEIFDAWSKKGKGYDRRENRAQWKSFKDKRHSVVTMRSIAKEVGDRAIYNIIDSADDDDDEDLIGAEETVAETVEGDENLADLFDDPPPHDPDLPGIPRRLLRIPGKLQHAVDFFNATAIRKQPQFAVQVALALGSAVLGRRYVTDSNNFTSLYLVNIVETASGKENIDTALQRMMDAAGLNLIGPDSFSSDSGVMSTLMEMPRCLAIIDEFAHFLIGLKNKEGPKSTVQSVLLKIFTKLHSKYRRTGFSSLNASATQKKELRNREVAMPALTMIGMTTPGLFYRNLGMGDVETGFVNRLLIVESPIEFPPELNREDARKAFFLKPHPRLVKWMKKYGEDDSTWEDMTEDTLANPGLTAVEPELIPFHDECDDLLEQMREDVRALFEEYKEFELASLFGRTREITMRVSLIVALSCESKTVRLSHLMWARDYVWFYHKRMAEILRVKLGRGEYAEIADFLIEKIRAAGKKGMTFNEMRRFSRKFDALDKRQQEEVLHRLLTENVAKARRKAEGRGRGAEVYVYIKPGSSTEENDDE